MHGQRVEGVGLWGAWDEGLWAEYPDGSRKRVWEADQPHQTSSKCASGKLIKRACLMPQTMAGCCITWSWTCLKCDIHRFLFSPWALHLNELTPELLAKLPPTDDRLRPDMRMFEHGYYLEASSAGYMPCL